MAVTRAWWPSPHYSSGGAPRRVIAFHTTEGSQTAESLRNWLTNPSSQVSYHFAVDNSHGNNWCANYVSPNNRCWAQANFNGSALAIAFCTPSGAASGWSRAKWLSMPNMLTAAGRLAGELARQYNIPMVGLNSSQAQGSGRGFCEHKNFGAGGSGHHDCGPGFPMDEVIRIAKGGGASPGAPAPKPQEEEEPIMFWLDWTKDGDPIPIVIPNAYTGGNARIRLGCNSSAVVRLDWPGADNKDISLDYGKGAQGTTIPKGTSFAVCRLREGKNLKVAVTYSK
jgi:N-acetylmuramoyl-L-alanine amidase-like protein